MRRSLAAALLFACLLSATLGVSAAPPRWHELEARAYGVADYVADFGRIYDSAEEAALRGALIAKRLAAIRAHNAGDAPYKMGVNQFTDRTDAELARLRGVRGARRVAPQAATPAPPRKAFAAAAGGELLPAAVDWRAKGVVTAVKNQGGCGSCWAFAATEAVESAFALATGRLEVLSEQQVLDCTPNPLECGGDGGCAGGTPELAFARMAELGGLASEWQYPYMSFTGQGVGPCRAAANATGGAPPLAEVTGFVQLPSNKAEPVLQALAEHGPLAVNVDASAWFAYESGVFTGCAKATEDIDHAVVVVGYGTDAATGLDYYLVRNSWSTAWGEAGYMRLLRQPGAPRCASDVTPFDGSDCRDVPDPVTTVTVCGECGILYDVSFPLVNVKAL